MKLKKFPEKHLFLKIKEIVPSGFLRNGVEDPPPVRKSTSLPPNILLAEFAG